MKSFADATLDAFPPSPDLASPPGDRAAERQDSTGKAVSDDPDLAEHYARIAAAVPALQAQRALEDAEIDSAVNTPGPAIVR